MTDTKTPHLLPCPFCGGDARHDAHADDCYFILHRKIKGSGADMSPAFEVLEAWNRRAPQAVASGEPVEHKQGCPALGGYGNGAEPCCCGAAPPPQALREPQPMPDLTQLTERGATAWAGVDAQALRGECTLQDFERSMAVRAEGRKPFTPAQQERLYRNRPANVGKSASLAEWRRTVEFVEAAHGITK